MSYEDTDDVESTEGDAGFIFCEGCGARLYATDRVCPKCGRPAPGILSTRSASADLSAGRTASFPRLSSDGADFSKKPGSAPEILSSSFDPSETNVLNPSDVEEAAKASKKKKKKDAEPHELTEDDFKRPRRWRWVVLAIVLVFIGGAAWFVVEDPLDVMPGLYEQFAEAAAEAFPSRYDSEEDAAEASDGSATEDASENASASAEEEITEQVLSDAEAFTVLSAIYSEIEGFGEELDEVKVDYEGWYIASDYSEREEASESAYTMRDHVQTVLDELEGIELADDSVYTEDLEHLTQLAEWMYSRVDVFCESWDISLALGEDESPSEHRSEIVQPLVDNQNEQDESQYEAYVDAWAPTEKS